MTLAALRPLTHTGTPQPRSGRTFRQVMTRRAMALGVILVPLGWAWSRVEGDVLKPAGFPLVGDLLGGMFQPSLAPDFLSLVGRATLITVAFAALGTLGALLLGGLGAIFLSEVALGAHPPLPLRLIRLVVRGWLVATRAIHELVWALLLVSFLGLDPLVAVLAIAIPFGAQAAKVFAETLDTAAGAPYSQLMHAGTPRPVAIAAAVIPRAREELISYSFYRFECALRSAVLLGIAGVGGLGAELVWSLQSRNWDEVWTLIWTVVALSALAEAWASSVRRRPGRRATWSLISLLLGVIGAWWYADVRVSSLWSVRSREAAQRLIDDMFPAVLPPRGWESLMGAVADTVAMALLAMLVASAITVVMAPLALRPHRPAPLLWLAYVGSRGVLLVIRSIPPTVWAVVALLVFFPGLVPGAVALGCYTGGILARLVADSWESLDRRPADLLTHAGVPGALSVIAAVVPSGARQFGTYWLYRFEICIRDTAVVGIVGAAGLGRLLGESLAAFRFDALTTVLMASIAISLLAEIASRQLRRQLSAATDHLV